MFSAEGLPEGTVFLLASLIPLGQAMERTGTAAWIAQEIMVILGDVPELAIQAALAVLATVFMGYSPVVVGCRFRIENFCFYPLESGFEW